MSCTYSKEFLKNKGKKTEYISDTVLSPNYAEGLLPLTLSPVYKFQTHWISNYSYYIKTLDNKWLCKNPAEIYSRDELIENYADEWHYHVHIRCPRERCDGSTHLGNHWNFEKKEEHKRNNNYIV